LIEINSNGLAFFQHKLENLLKIIKVFEVKKIFAENSAKSISVSSIVCQDLLRQTSLDKYKEKKEFLEYHRFPVGAEFLREYLQDSVNERNYLIPDYDNEKDFSDALDGAEE
jgi:hypothetical protein